MGIVEDFHDRRNSGNKKISDQDYLPYKRFISLDTRAYQEGSIPVKYKEMMGLTSSLVLGCDDCVIYHLERCVELGCTGDELNEAMNISLVIGGSKIIPHLRHALSALKELMN